MNESRVHIIDRKSKFWNILIKIQRVILFLTSLLVTLVISSGAIMRYIFKVDFYGIEDITLVIAFFMYFTGGMYASYSKTHITAEVIPNHIKNKRSRNKLLIFKSLFTVVLSWLFTYWGFSMIKWTFLQGGKTATLNIPLTIPQGMVFIGFFFMSFYFTVYAIEDILNYKKDNYTDFIIWNEVVEE